MIFDSSIWIDYLKGRKTAFTDLLDTRLAKYEEVDVHLCPTIVQEVLQGIPKENDPALIRELLFSCQFLNLDSYFVAENAAAMYRSLRMQGVTINKPNDCLIAYYSIHFNLVLVHNDRDFDRIASCTKLKIKR